MVSLLRTDSAHPDFITLVKMLDADLAVRDGEDTIFYAPLNKTDAIRHVIVAYVNEQPVGCGAIREFDAGSMEVKRMFTLPATRGKGVATRVLNELQNWSKELGYEKCILETGKRQPEAIALYLKNCFVIIPNYGKYVGIENSVCFEKVLTKENAES
jgi:GNAT superfamily N-acetyltransferase